MIVVTQHVGGYFIPIHYAGVGIKAYLAKQIKSTISQKEITSIELLFEETFELEIPPRTKVHKGIRANFEVFGSKKQRTSIIYLPSIGFKINRYESDNKLKEKWLSDPDNVMWKDILIMKSSLEQPVLSLLERISIKQNRNINV
tara:strand:+ start:1148 stop:1579 length:432 start_codon:yes stop_codon:yes gene_type:complete